MNSTIPYEFKYRPTRFDEMILAEDVKPVLEKALKELPNMILYGPSGTGKGTFVDVLKETGIDILKLNCSDETGIDSIREKVKTFAQSIGFGDLKIVYLNESDYLSHNAQAMLRDLMEQVHKYTRFIFCCNYVHKMIPELLSRCQQIELSNPPALEVAKRCFYILDQEGVQYNKKTVVDIVKSIWQKKPDVRKTLVVLRENVIDGVLRENIVMSASEEVFEQVLVAMKSGDPEQVWSIFKNHQIDFTGLYKHIRDAIMTEEKVFSKDGAAIILLGEAERWDSLAANRDGNFITMYFSMLERGII